MSIDIIIEISFVILRLKKWRRCLDVVSKDIISILMSNHIGIVIYLTILYDDVNYVNELKRNIYIIIMIYYSIKDINNW